MGNGGSAISTSTTIRRASAIGVDSYAMVLLLPDLMVQNRWEPLWERLGLLDVEIAALTPAAMTPGVVARVYADNRPRSNRPRVDASWLGRAEYDYDMTLAVLFRTPGRKVDLAELLADWKGPSRYGDRGDGAIRSISPIADRCSSVLHTPDDEAGSTALETLLLLGDASRKARAGQTVADPRDVGRLRSYCAPSDDPHPFDIVWRCLRRMMTLLACDVYLEENPTARTVIERIEAMRIEHTRVAPALQREHLRASLCQLAELVNNVPRPQVDVYSDSHIDSARLDKLGRSRASLYDAVSTLCAGAPIDYRVCELVVDAMASCGLHLDTWEVHRLQVATVCFEEFSR